jgi:prepilin-type N-terminal cleavage/methylation domain-containing protein
MGFGLSSAVGFTLAELLIVLALSGILAALTLNLITKTPSGTYGRLAEDYARHLASVYEQYQLKNGQPFDLTTNNVASLLPTWESIAIYTSSSPELLTYPSRVIVYIKPEQVSGMSATTLAGTNNREWVMMDVNGTTGPNSLSSSGDRVLFYIENTSGRVLTAYQKCQEDGTTTYTQSFYDLYKGY